MARPAQGGAGVDLIAEPYTANLAGQEQGNFPVGWSEWNDRYRDVFRAWVDRDTRENERPLLSVGVIDGDGIAPALSVVVGV